MNGLSQITALVGTQHPANGGGVLSMLQSYLQWLRDDAKLEPSLAYRPFRGPVRHSSRPWFSKPGVVSDSFEGVTAYEVGDWVSRLEALYYAGNHRLWKNLLDRFDVHQVVCGYALTGLPYALSEKPFVIWVATSMDGDKQARLQSSGFARKLLHRAQIERLRRQESFVLNRAAWVFALSPQTAEELLDRGARRDRLSVLNCPISTKLFHPPKPKAAPSDPIVMWAGRHADPRKNTRLLVRAFARVIQAVPSVRLLLVGETDPVLRRELRDAGETRIEFTGPKRREEMADYYRQATVFAVPSEQEGLGIAAIEAMACGVPVVSTKCGGTESFVIPGVNGVLVEKFDETAMADALIGILTDPGLRDRLGTNANRYVSERYGWESFRGILSGVYSRIWPGIFESRREPSQWSSQRAGMK